jgi:hypothetical protein
MLQKLIFTIKINDFTKSRQWCSTPRHRAVCESCLGTTHFSWRPRRPTPPSGETITRKASRAPKGAIITRKAYKPPIKGGRIPTIRYDLLPLSVTTNLTKNQKKQGKERKKEGKKRE